MGNCTMIHCGRLNYEADVKTMAMKVKPDELDSLADLEYIQRNVRAGESDYSGGNATGGDSRSACAFFENAASNVTSN
jgi:hypothetical protein